MEWKDMPRRAYYEKYERMDVKNDGGWYEVYRLPKNVYAIAEPRHFQEVNFFLIVGTDRAVLFDTGMGIVPVKPLIDELYQGEMIAVNSHFHFDHIGSNHIFEPVNSCVDSYVSGIAKRGLTCADVGAQMDEDMFKGGYPQGFAPDRYAVPSYQVKAVREGYIFDLGNRKLRVLHTPGHSFDSLMLYDEDNKILFTGDTFYMGALYAHFNCAQFGCSDISMYWQTMDRLSREIPEDVQLYCSHNDFIAPAAQLRETAEVLRTIIEKESVPDGEKGVGKGHQYLEEESILCEKKGDGFSVVYTNEKVKEKKK